MPEKEPQKISTFGSRVTSTVSVMLVLILSGLAAMLATVTHNIDTGLRNSLGFTVQPCRDADPTDIDARSAGVPIVLGAFNFETKEVVLEKTFTPTGDVEADMKAVKDYYRPFKGKYPHKFSAE